MSKKSRARTVEKTLRALESPGTKSEKNCRQTTNNLEETPYVFFASTVSKAWANIPSIAFYFLSSGTQFYNFSMILKSIMS